MRCADTRFGSFCSFVAWMNLSNGFHGVCFTAPWATLSLLTALPIAYRSRFFFLFAQLWQVCGGGDRRRWQEQKRPADQAIERIIATEKDRIPCLGKFAVRLFCFVYIFGCSSCVRVWVYFHLKRSVLVRKLFMDFMTQQLLYIYIYVPDRPDYRWRPEFFYVFLKKKRRNTEKEKKQKANNRKIF